MQKHQSRYIRHDANSLNYAYSPFPFCRSWRLRTYQNPAPLTWQLRIRTLRQLRHCRAVHRLNNRCREVFRLRGLRRTCLYDLHRRTRQPELICWYRPAFVPLSLSLYLRWSSLRLSTLHTLRIGLGYDTYLTLQAENRLPSADLPKSGLYLPFCTTLSCPYWPCRDSSLWWFRHFPRVLSTSLRLQPTLQYNSRL